MPFVLITNKSRYGQFRGSQGLTYLLFQKAPLSLSKYHWNDEWNNLCEHVIDAWVGRRMTERVDRGMDGQMD